MRPAVIFFIFILSICPPLYPHTHKSLHHSIDPLYSSALAAANRFLRAWQDQDQETGIMMLSDTARLNLSPEKLHDFFSPGPDAAYEIARGKRVSSAAFEFPVVLFGASTASSRPHACTVVVSRSGKNEWAVDKLP
jgi:hypothetical protein